MRLCRLWILSAFLALACGSVPVHPKVGTLDCLARDDCYVVKVDNAFNKHSVELKLNGVVYGQVESYETKDFNIFYSQLIHGNCALASARMIDTRDVIKSDEACIVRGEYYSIQILNVPWKMWLVALRIKQ